MAKKDSATVMSSDDRISLLEAQVATLKAAVDYAVYGIGNPHPDPRDETPEPTEDQ